MTLTIAPRAPQPADRCRVHPTYFLASCDECRQAQAVRTAEVRARLAHA